MAGRRNALSMPMALTMTRFVLAPVLIALCRVQTTVGDLAAVVVLVLAMVTDFLDGHLARRQDRVTDVGRLLDPLADAFVYVSLFLCFCLDGWMPLWMFVAVLYREILIHGFLRRLLLMKGIVLAASRWGKLKTLLQTISGIAVLLCVALARGDIGFVSIPSELLRTLAYWLLFVVTVASVGSFVTYMRQAVRLIREREQGGGA